MVYTRWVPSFFLYQLKVYRTNLREESKHPFRVVEHKSHKYVLRVEYRIRFVIYLLACLQYGWFY
jgi:hypothetical protein